LDRSFSPLRFPYPRVTVRLTNDSRSCDIATQRLVISASSSLLEAGHTHAGDAGHVHTEAAGHARPDHAHHAVLIIGITLIMMSPFVFPLLRTVARSTMWTEAAVAVAAAWGGFIGLWCVAAIAMHVIGEMVVLALTSWGATALLTLACVVAQVSRRRAWMLNACGLTHPMRPGHPVQGGFTWGTVGAVRCVQVGAAPMTLMALSPALGGAAAITALMWWERFSQRRRELRGVLALSYTVIGAAMLIGASL
jgi:hypothetical protein